MALRSSTRVKARDINKQNKDDCNSFCDVGNAKISSNMQSEILPRKRAACGNITNAHGINLAPPAKKTFKGEPCSDRTNLKSGPQRQCSRKENSENSSSDSKKPNLVKIKHESVSLNLKKEIEEFADVPAEITIENEGTNLKCEPVFLDVEIGEEIVQAASAQSTGTKAESIESIDQAEVQVESGLCDFDKECMNDPFAASEFVVDIFKYYREQEDLFAFNKYMETQTELSRGMRSILVDWMVEVQESFELNHETLYLAVKLIDMYLMKNIVSRDVLQLVGATALFISCKYDERCPPLTDDFLYICDEAYTKNELLMMEVNMLKSIDFKLGMPLSYRFLRRYARCNKIPMDTLTLARYILELSLMEYELLELKDSLVAAAALSLAMQMKKTTSWNSTLERCSSYKGEELKDLVQKLNVMLLTPTKCLQTIRNKYSHKVFYQVAKIEPLEMVH